MQYHDHILEHYHNPLNHKSLSSPTHSAKAKNPSCGDELIFSLKIEGEKIQEIGWTGSGCAISQASASLLSEHVKEKSQEEILALETQDVLNLLELPLSPGRLKCGILSLEALHKALLSKQV